MKQRVSRPALRGKRLFGGDARFNALRKAARTKPYDFVAVGQDDAAHLLVEASAIRRNDDYSASAVAFMLESAARAVCRANAHARFENIASAKAAAPKRKRS